ncbi:MAG: insulinase family protein [Anaerolineae bacterium]|nr:insulinase family protein [Anaerolineae bacterium]
MTPTASSLPGPETIARRVLPNGIIALARENYTSPTVTVNGLVAAGSVTEPDSQAGLASFAASLLTRGTERRSFAEINETVEGVGASIGVSGGQHASTFSGESLAEDLPLILDVLADVLQHPIFPADHVEKVRGQILTGIQERENDTRRMAGLTFRETLFPQHPYGRAMGGYRETVQAIAREDLAGFYRQQFRPQGAVVAVVGAIEAQAALDHLEATLGSWQVSRNTGNGKTSPLALVSEPASVRRKDVVMAGKTQSDIVLGCIGLERRNPDFYAANLANTVLGRFGLMGRLGENVREKQGLAYYAYSALEAGMGRGPWMAVAGVNPRNVERAIASILEEVERLRREPVPADELADVKGYITGSLPLRLETNGGMASTLLDMEWYGLGLDYLQRYFALINGVTTEQILVVTQRYLNPEAYVLAVAGPAES